MILYRVFPYDASATPTSFGGPLFVPTTPSVGRIATPDLYRELYLAFEPEAAIAEVFSAFATWRNGQFTNALGLPYVVTPYELDDSSPLFNADDSPSLVTAGIVRPSRIATPNRTITRTWARSIFLGGSYHGVRYWSRHNADWTVCGLWDVRQLRHVGPPELLSITHAHVVTAARTIVRQLR